MGSCRICAAASDAPYCHRPGLWGSEKRPVVLELHGYATLDRPRDGSAYIRCPARELCTSVGSVQVRIELCIGQYYLNEEQADALDGLVA